MNVIDSNVTLMDEVDITNTPLVPLLPLIDVTDFVTDVVFCCIVVDLLNVVDVDSLTSCVPSINFTLNELPEVYLCPYAVPIF